MRKIKLFLLLVLLAAVATGAVAQEETLLTTITPTGDGTYSETTAGAVTVTPAGSFFYTGSSYGWVWDYYGSLTVTANEGYTITRCVFIQQGNNQSVTISDAPFALNFEERLCLENYSMDGVSSIEVYGTAPAAPAGYAVSLKAETADEGNWTAKAGEGEYQSLPLEGVAQGTQVTVTYAGLKKVKSVKAVKKAPAPAPTLTAAPTAIDGLTYDGTAQALVNAGTATNGTLQYKLGTDGEYSTSIPTATDAGSYTVYYKVVGAAGFVDLDEASVEVEIAAAPVSYTAPTIVSSTLTYNGSGQALVTGGSATGGTIYYRYDYTPYSGSASSSEWSTTVPAPTNAGTYTIYYKVEPNAGYSGGVESTQLGSKVINKANGWVTLSPNSSTGWTTVTVSKDATATISHHGGSLSVTNKSGNYANNVTATISGNILQLSRKMMYRGDGTTVTVTSAATNNYNAASANYYCN